MKFTSFPRQPRFALFSVFPKIRPLMQKSIFIAADQINDAECQQGSRNRQRNRTHNQTRYFHTIPSSKKLQFLYFYLII